jgi:hypothetical protein
MHFGASYHVRCYLGVMSMCVRPIEVMDFDKYLCKQHSILHLPSHSSIFSISCTTLTPSRILKCFHFMLHANILYSDRFFRNESRYLESTLYPFLISVIIFTRLVLSFFSIVTILDKNKNYKATAYVIDPM